LLADRRKQNSEQKLTDLLPVVEIQYGPPKRLVEFFLRFFNKQVLHFNSDVTQLLLIFFELLYVHKDRCPLLCGLANIHIELWDLLGVVFFPFEFSLLPRVFRNLSFF